MTHYPVKPANRANARRMRHALTDAELKLWNALRAHRLMGMSFRRQMPINGFIVDFACPSEKLIAELDGSQHNEGGHVQADARRAAALHALGWQVPRFPNDDVLRDVDGACTHVLIVAGKDREAAGVLPNESFSA